MEITGYDIFDWIEENKKFFIPPICNKLMYKDGQLKTFFVGGPNSRTDFHLELGEEFFYQVKGEAQLVVHENGKFRDISIKEGDVFLLPARIPHSPQRFSDTIGLVIERERLKHELDCIRYYVDGSDEILYEKWFHCVSLEAFAPLIKEFFASEQHRTGKPIPGTLLDDKPIKQDFKRKLDEPFSLRTWLRDNKANIEKHKKVKIFNGDFVSRIHILGKGPHTSDVDLPETFLLQIEGTSIINYANNNYEFREDQTLLIPSGERYTIHSSDSSRILSVIMNPNE